GDAAAGRLSAMRAGVPVTVVLGLPAVALALGRLGLVLGLVGAAFGVGVVAAGLVAFRALVGRLGHGGAVPRPGRGVMSDLRHARPVVLGVLVAGAGRRRRRRARRGRRRRGRGVRGGAGR